MVCVVRRLSAELTVVDRAKAVRLCVCVLTRATQIITATRRGEL